jgi:hypothetical protein
MRLRIFFVSVLVFVLPLLAVSAYADELGPTLLTYAALGGSGVTNASAGGPAATIIDGNLGVSPAAITSCTGFPAPCTGGGPGIVSGTIQSGTEAAAQSELTSALISLAGKTPITMAISAGNLTNNTLGPGFYTVASQAVDLADNSTLKLTGTGEFVFLMSSSLTTGSGTTLDTSGLGAGSSVYWVAQAGSFITLGVNTDWAGNLLSPSAITFDLGAQDPCGRALAKTLVHFDGVGTTTETGEGAVEPNLVGGAGCTGNLAGSGGLNGGGPGPGPVSTPEPGTFALLSSGLALGLLTLRKLR